MSKKVYIDFELRYKEAVKNLDEMNKEYTKLEKKVQKYEKQVEKAEKKQGDFGATLDKVTGGAVTKFKGMTDGIKSATLGFKGLKAALIASGIGLFVVLLGSLAAAFTQSEEGQEKLQRGLAALGAVVKNTMDLLSDLGNTIISAFKVVGNVVTGNFDKLSESTAELAVNVGKTGDAIKNFVKDTISEVKAIDEVTKARQKAHHIERALQVERAQANRDINELRLKAEDRERFSASERVKMLRQAQAIEESITNKEIEAQKLLIKAQQEEMALGKNTIEDKDKLAELQAKLINLDTKRLRSQRLLQTQITTAINQEKAEKQKEVDELNKGFVYLPGVGFVSRESIEQMRKNGEEVDKILKDFEQKKEDERAETEAQKLELEKSRKLAELDELNATEAQKADIILYYNDLISKAKQKDIQDEAKRDKILERQKIATVANTMGAIANLLGKNSKAGKALAIGQALINTYLGVTEVLSTKSTLPEPFATISRVGNIATVLATGMQSVKAIQSTNPKSASGAANISTRGGEAAAPQVPAFNIVGQSVTNQLADVIAGQSGQPTRAYVVSNDVSTAQELDRNIIQGASIG